MGGQDADAFMADLLNDIDSSPLPSSSASRAKTPGTTRIKPSRDAPRAPPLALARSSQHHASTSSAPSQQSQQSFTPGKLSLGQISKLAFQKPGSSLPGGPSRAVAKPSGGPAGASAGGAFVKGSAQCPNPKSHQSWSSGTSSASSRLPPAAQRPKEARPTPPAQSVSVRTFAHAKSDSQIPLASGYTFNPQKDSAATKPSPSRKFPDTFVDDDSFASMGDDDAWMADVEEAALAAPVALIKKEEEDSVGTKASSPAPDSSDSMVKRVSRTQSKLWAQRAKTSQVPGTRCSRIDLRPPTTELQSYRSTPTEDHILCGEASERRSIQRRRSARG
ncbi:hypothetical protein BCV69DRAFT_210088 [Microstroma glucosiphilum]|uniref:Uncharacterized protein n=1 Tax=Pseudomicrostroma glucosiphilum TaxID=1684307 RepID=A0A316UBN6_9BASI|nr:hypothetical protein BCV69DRAFT_210088 [Pseudomicrostroma glucosiphilum]PWN20435.1 hypothetical protein BCV69DRAFT_210088 [Pseudomicrostroma glucosiphilum]